MITSDQEQQVKLQFLDEATDYLDTLESGLLGLGAGKVADKQLDALLRNPSETHRTKPAIPDR